MRRKPRVYLTHLSARSRFDVGLLTKADWAGAVWVASQATPRLTTCQMYEVHPAPYFQRTFSITQKVRRLCLLSRLQ